MPSGCPGTRGQERLGMISQKFERLSVLSYVKEASQRSDHYQVHCDCGKELIVSGASLRNGHTRSCGCLRYITILKFGKQAGENNPRYYHGFSYKLRKFRKTVHARDKVCQYNDDGECKGRLEAHHLDGDRYNDDPKNGSLLCRKHHIMVTKDDNVWRPK